jgi:hypothetical protein
MAQARGTFPGLYDNVDKVVFSVAEETLKDIPPIWKKYFRTETSTRKFERYQDYAAFTSPSPLSEGDDLTTQNLTPGSPKDLTHLKWRLGFEVTEEAADDDEFSVIKNYARGLRMALRVAQETYAARLIGQGFSGGVETTPDGQPIYSASHVVLTGGTASNLVSADLSRTALETALTLARTDGKSAEGFFMEPPSGWFLEVPPALEFLATRIVKSTNINGSADNDINAIKANYQIDVVVNPYIADTDSWRIVAKNQMHGLLTIVRKAVAMDAPVTVDRSKNRLYSAGFRQSWGAIQYQGVVGSPGA